MQDQKNNFTIPAAIILAGFLIATGIYLSNRGNNPVNNTNKNQVDSITINPVSTNDHILGDPNAPIVLVEFSDTECPYCKMFQTTMHSIMDMYGKDGKVAWVYRHFPLDSLHPKTRKEAEATECVNELGGNTAFWKMLDLIYTNTPSNNGLDPAQLPVFAVQSGVNLTKFSACLDSGKYASVVQSDLEDGARAGAQGTPYSVLLLKNEISVSARATLGTYISKNSLDQNIVISPSGKQIVLSGALPVEIIQTVIDTILK